MIAWHMLTVAALPMPRRMSRAPRNLESITLTLLLWLLGITLADFSCCLRRPSELRSLMWPACSACSLVTTL